MPRNPEKSRKPAPRKKKRRSSGEIAPFPPLKRSVAELEKASRDASANGRPAPQKQI
jgi:hypothetical protein